MNRNATRTNINCPLSHGYVNICIVCVIIYKNNNRGNMLFRYKSLFRYRHLQLRSTVSSLYTDVHSAYIMPTHISQLISYMCVIGNITLTRHLIQMFGLIWTLLRSNFLILTARSNPTRLHSIHPHSTTAVHRTTGKGGRLYTI